MNEETGRQRIDKWLWYARLCRTRTIAQKLVQSGGVRINREKIDAPSRPVKPGDVLTVALERQVRVVKILDPGTRRGPAPEAQRLYEDLTPPKPPVDTPQSGGPRPTKRDRRAIDAFNSASSPFSEDDFSDDGED
ncbi:RNA-binding S4 domain-containing protein [Kaistia dalseonensis]|uniref:Ribosome-associated heat shock protein Hsp15 n=1 Tax=Kaistia dalseonensis TaxID=410840 RepID=A0ABU0H5R9_9HYPH|nr:RNA-binding S4 domain-containing protein [Kaistia dalseonensis]MCX5494638.1 RNA-binding S4 domain-containing protein [Kaistia dalseonensis]MDQ0437218.1 ribosome-associated heat shock protein Hsp15 [Kaistia dalseonensis]